MAGLGFFKNAPREKPGNVVSPATFGVAMLLGNTTSFRGALGMVEVQGVAGMGLRYCNFVSLSSKNPADNSVNVCLISCFRTGNFSG